MAKRINNAQETSVRRLSEVLRQRGTIASDAQIRDFFRELERLGLGEFVVGRRGQESRFRWFASLIEIGRAARGEVVEMSHATDEERATWSNDDTSESGDGAERSPATEMVTHRYRLRRGLEITLHLPDDLEATEANRLADFIRTLPL